MGADGALTFRYRLPGDMSAPWRARDFLIDLGLPRGTFLEQAMLLTSELVTDTILHAANAELDLEIRMGRERLRVEVHPANGAIGPDIPHEEDADEPLRLSIVDRIATAWGIHENGYPGLWFELTVPKADPRTGVW